MHELILQLQKWRERGDAIALATVIKTWGSSPRPAGAKLAVNEHCEMIGSVSGGCVENAVIEEALAVLKTGKPKLLTFGVSDEEAWEVGLACGGTIAVFVEKINEPLEMLLRMYQHGETLVLATITRGEEKEIGKHVWWKREGMVTSESSDTALAARMDATAQTLLGQERTALVNDSVCEIFLESFCPRPKLVIVGAVHIAIPLVTFARELGYQVILIDPRRAFASPERFPHVEELIARWPEVALAEIGIDASTCIVVLTHDPKLDDPAVKFALQQAPAYIGVLGSRKTHEKRLQRLRAEGVSEEQLARLHAPIGLAIGALSPAEIALSIMSEIVAVRRGAATAVQTRMSNG